MRLFDGWKLLLLGILCVAVAHAQDDNIEDEEDFDTGAVDDVTGEEDTTEEQQPVERVRGFRIFSYTLRISLWHDALLVDIIQLYITMWICCILQPDYRPPELKGHAHFAETFDDPDAIGETWVAL